MDKRDEGKKSFKGELQSMESKRPRIAKIVFKENKVVGLILYFKTYYKATITKIR